MILETERLYLRELTSQDLDSLALMLKDAETMFYYEGVFNDQEVNAWLERQIARYHKWGFGLWGVVLKETNQVIGQCGLTMQPWKNKEVLEVGYLFNKAFWHRGYATEAAKACMEYAFSALKAKEVCSIIRDTNLPSQLVAIRNGLKARDTWIKHYRNVDMPHTRFVITKEAYIESRRII